MRHDFLSQANCGFGCLGRRVAKHVLTEDKSETTRFLWQGLRLLQEQKTDLQSLYIYEQGSYAPPARVDTEPNQPDAKPKRYYFHTDQIGTPLEVTDDTSRMVWGAYYKTWVRWKRWLPERSSKTCVFRDSTTMLKQACTTIRSLLRSTGGTIYELFEADEPLSDIRVYIRSRNGTHNFGKV